MAGGLLQLLSPAKGLSLQFIGNPQKTFFKVKYQQYTNFGIQKFRIDYEGSKNMLENADSHFTFKIKRLGDLLKDVFIVINLPDIWSSIYKTDSTYKEYKFKWIENIGTEILKEITINIGSQEIMKYSGSYLTSRSYRDLDSGKKMFFNQMTGNIDEINNPEKLFNNNYPTAMFTDENTSIQPSIKGRKLYIPIHTWFENSKTVLPLISLQNVETTINITLRPINDLFTFVDKNGIRRRTTGEDNEQMYNFLTQPPNDISGSDDKIYNYSNKSNSWNFDLHLISNYIFLSNEERKYFALVDQKYTILQVFESNHENIGGSKKVILSSNGLVSNLMFYFYRNDIKLRNEWSNYTNWEYSESPQILAEFNSTDNKYYRNDISFNNPFPDGITQTPVTGSLNLNYNKTILKDIGVIVDGKYRENMFDEGIFNYIENYNKPKGLYKNGLYNYYYSLNNDNLQPSGFIDASFFKNFELEIVTRNLEIDASKNIVEPICATVTDELGNDVNTIVGYSKTNVDEDIFKYNYNLRVFEERINVLIMSGGECYLEVKT